VETTPMSYPGIAWNYGIYYNKTPILGERALSVISITLTYKLKKK
jgi:hypothetical protein